MLVRIAAFTHQGRQRRRNEDCIAVGDWIRHGPMTAAAVSTHTLLSIAQPDDNPVALDAPLAPRGGMGVRAERCNAVTQSSIDRPLIALIADGMGGHPAGDVASRFAAERLASDLPHVCGSDGALRKALQRVNRELIAEARTEPARIAMGTTIAGVAVLPEEVVVFNIGDSRVYRADEGVLEQVSIDDVPHYYIPVLGVELRTGELTQHLGGVPYEMPIEPHIVRLPIAGAQTWLICSDGLYDMVDDETIVTAISDDLAASVQALFDAAMRAGGADNISIILLRTERGD
ncbi:MAG: serine/threonine-protein phosphatase [Betaproteobacteria bacterium]|nr:serine/threonine-protein phosphatase [Betaproteobacteria bacterium]